ncbi:uncharacterized protein LOC124283766 isoform X2 [Haliotis rubra]|nr:uncharacterized protein LOC124283766 isoform X2 [Haliotis rubra]XP_046575743.1 uncharacterized protein LOC124283766 isoform X2 [Haliotis rubra]XP_046575744.1 uncharacterized protein LOC124283766 isoform X2 [Haliotis rubra]
MFSMARERSGDTYKEYTTLQQRLDRRKQDLDTLIQRREAFVKTKDDVTAGIRKTFAKTRELLDLKEQSLVSHIERRTQREMESLDSFIASERQEIEKREEIFQDLVNDLQRNDGGGNCDAEKFIQELRLNDLQPLPKVPFIEAKSHDEDVIDCVTRLQICTVRFVEDNAPNSKLVNKVLVVFDDDPRACNIKDIAVLGGEVYVVIMTDFANRRVKALCGEGGNLPQRKHKLDMKHGPWGVTKISDFEVAVTVPEEKKIVFMRVLDDMHVRKTVKTKRKYCGIASLADGTFAVCCEDHPSVDILNMDGQFMKDLSKYYACMFKAPSSICATASKSLAVTDSVFKCVMIISKDGELLTTKPSTADSLKSAVAVACDASGHVFVVDNVDSNVIMVDEEVSSAVASDVAKGKVNTPTAVGLDNAGRLYIADDKFLMVFKITY